MRVTSANHFFFFLFSYLSFKVPRHAKTFKYGREIYFSFWLLSWFFPALVEPYKFTLTGLLSRLQLILKHKTVLSWNVIFKLCTLQECYSVRLFVIFFNPLPINQFESQIYLWISLNMAEILRPFKVNKIGESLFNRFYLSYFWKVSFRTQYSKSVLPNMLLCVLPNMSYVSFRTWSLN